MVNWFAKYLKCLHILARNVKLKEKSWKSYYMIKDMTKYS